MTEAQNRFKVRITGLYYYPVKSCRGHLAAEIPLGPQGFRHDRRFLVVRAEDGTFLTQRELPRMARIDPSLSVQKGEVLTLSAPEISSLSVPLSNITNDAPRVRVTIWKDSPVATDMGDAAARWLTDFLGVPCRLVYAPEDFDRPVDARYGLPEDRVGFADGFPVLLATDASLADLNARIQANGGEPVPMERFRPNIVVSGAEGEALPPYAEDGWRRLWMRGSAHPILRVVKPSSRCVMTTLDPLTGDVRGPEPLRTLATYRRSENGKVMFAQNLIPDTGGATITLRIGDILEAE